MEEGRAGSPHLLVHALLQRLALRGAECIPGDAPPRRLAWSSSSKSRAALLARSGLSQGRWELDKLLSSQTRVRKEGFGDRAASFPSPVSGEGCS